VDLRLGSALLAAPAGRTVLLITRRPVHHGDVDRALRLTGGRLEPVA
jgi:hypothetical protein